NSFANGRPVAGLRIMWLRPRLKRSARSCEDRAGTSLERCSLAIAGLHPRAGGGSFRGGGHPAGGLPEGTQEHGAAGWSGEFARVALPDRKERDDRSFSRNERERA